MVLSLVQIRVLARRWHKCLGFNNYVRKALRCVFTLGHYFNASLLIVALYLVKGLTRVVLTWTKVYSALPARLLSERLDSLGLPIEFHYLNLILYLVILRIILSG
jgi:hypothetical protein